MKVTLNSIRLVDGDCCNRVFGLCTVPGCLISNSSAMDDSCPPSFGTFLDVVYLDRFEKFKSSNTVTTNSSRNYEFSAGSADKHLYVQYEARGPGLSFELGTNGSSAGA